LINCCHFFFARAHRSMIYASASGTGTALRLA
jgi:hypothetical protein